MLQNIVIRSASPGTQKRTTGPLKTYSTVVDSSLNNSPVSTQMKSILVTNSGTGAEAPNVIKIRTSTGSHLVAQQSSSSSVVQKTITTAGGTQFLQIHSHGGGAAGGAAAGGGGQFILNSVRQAQSAANTQTQVGNNVTLSNASISVKGTQLKQGSQIVQLPAKTTLLKGSPVAAARVMKTVAGGQAMVRTVGGLPARMISTSAQPGMGQLVTLMEAGGGGKVTHSTPIRIGKAGSGTTANVIQLAATNGTGGGGAAGHAQYTVLSPGTRSVIQLQQAPKGTQANERHTQLLNTGKMGTGGGGGGDAVKPAIR